MTTPKLGLSELIASQAQPHLTLNSALRVLDALVQAAVLAFENDPPVSPTDGDAYIIDATPTGEWTDHPGEIAVLIGGAWSYFAPAAGWLVFNDDDGEHYRHDGSAWAIFESGGGGGGGELADLYSGKRAVYRVLGEQTSPPGSPSEGDVYLLQRSDSLSGAWSSFDRGDLAWYDGADWQQLQMLLGHIIYREDLNEFWYCSNDTSDPKIYTPLKDGERWPIYKATSPGSNEVIGRYVFTRTVMIPADFAGSQGSVGANPSSSFVLDVELDGSPIGTITISTGGAFTFDTSASEYGAGAGSVLEVIAPSTTNGSIARIAMTLVFPTFAAIPF